MLLNVCWIIVPAFGSVHSYRTVLFVSASRQRMTYLKCSVLSNMDHCRLTELPLRVATGWPGWLGLFCVNGTTASDAGLYPPQPLPFSAVSRNSYLMSRWSFMTLTWIPVIRTLFTLIQWPFSVRASSKYPITGGPPAWISGGSYFTVQLVVLMSLMTGAVGGKGIAESQAHTVIIIQSNYQRDKWRQKFLVY